MKNYMDSKATPSPRYKVNILSKDKKEIWSFCSSIKKARELQQEAISNALDSSIYQKKDGKYILI